jgi:hypothetical protein
MPRDQDVFDTVACFVADDKIDGVHDTVELLLAFTGMGNGGMT